MFQWLKNLFRSDPVAERNIFNYWDGYQTRYADPLVLQRELDKAGGDNWTGLLGLLKLGSGLAVDVAKIGEEQAKRNVKQSREAAEELVGIVRKAFDVKTFRQHGRSAQCVHSLPEFEGLTDSECLDLLGEFFMYMSDVEDEAFPSPSLPQPTESPTASSPIG